MPASLQSHSGTSRSLSAGACSTSLSFDRTKRSARRRRQRHSRRFRRAGGSFRARCQGMPFVGWHSTKTSCELTIQNTNLSSHAGSRILGTLFQLCKPGTHRTPPALCCRPRHRRCLCYQRHPFGSNGCAVGTLMTLH